MQDLRLVGIHEDGEHVLLADADGNRFRVPLDDALRSAARRERQRSDRSGADDDAVEQMRPRDVQGLIRAGVSVGEVADRSGWSEEKVRKYEPPIRAERDYVAGLARGVQLRGRARDGAAPILGTRAAQRLDERGVEAERVVWDSWKTESGSWTVVCVFPAGGRERRATWRFDPRDRTLAPADDEARWLSEDEAVQGPIPAPPVTSPGRNVRVYDVEAEGGLQAHERHPAGKGRSKNRDKNRELRPAASQPTAEPEPEEDHDTLDLMSAMRERSAARRKRPARRTPTPTDTPVSPEEMPDDAKPVERLRLADGPPPMGSHTAPGDLSADGEDEEIAPEDPVTGTADLFGDLDEDVDDASDDESADDDDDADDDAGEVTAEAVDDPDEVEDSADDDAAESQGVLRVPSRQSGARRNRPSVPSWDDIMFGTRPSSEH
ncbi:septation protein SepH [Luteipulveratus mongoliensis]|uniref:septation protein SepH n=1 Tax=Luteipulveratus mongoliensis TaxID=571913 RepID=UPI0012ED8A04|nr:septation protein SepH [Luteipulveratus mongoliensis]